MALVMKSSFYRTLTVTALVVALLAFSADATGQPACACKKATTKETTRIGGNETVVIREKRIVSFVIGRVDTYNDPQLEVLVEVFDNPDHLLRSYPENRIQRKLQKRIAACKTGADGRFCLQKIPKGTYEVRFSVGPEWNVVSVYLEIDPKAASHVADDFYVGMKLGT